jgi:hypothetical protein
MKIADTDEIITEYKLHNILEPEGFIYIMIILGLYGLPHTGLLFMANSLVRPSRNLTS